MRMLLEGKLGAWRRTMLPAREMPTGLFMGVFLSALFEAAALTASAFASFGDQTSDNTVNVGRPPLPAHSPIAWTLLIGMVAITWGCRTGRAWARYAAIAFWILPVATLPLVPPVPEVWAEAMKSAAIAASIAAYLFRNEAVERFFVRSDAARARSVANSRVLT